MFLAASLKCSKIYINLLVYNLQSWACLTLPWQPVVCMMDRSDQTGCEQPISYGSKGAIRKFKILKSFTLMLVGMVSNALAD